MLEQHDIEHNAIDDVVSLASWRRASTLAVDWPRKSASNDHAYDDAGRGAREAEAWARHALATNGFGDAGPSIATTPQRFASPSESSQQRVSARIPTSYELYHAARARRTLLMIEMATPLVVVAVAAARRALAHWRRRFA